MAITGQLSRKLLKNREFTNALSSSRGVTGNPLTNQLISSGMEGNRSINTVLSVSNFNIAVTNTMLKVNTENNGNEAESTEEVVALMAEDYLFSMGVTIESQTKTYNLKSTVATTEIITNPNILDPAFGEISNERIVATDKFANELDPFYNDIGSSEIPNYAKTNLTQRTFTKRKYADAINVTADLINLQRGKK